MSRHRLPDGTVWTTATEAAELVEVLCHGEPTRDQLLAAASVLGAYLHIATHPAGTESIIRQVRMLRRAAEDEMLDAVDREPEPPKPSGPARSVRRSARRRV